MGGNDPTTYETSDEHFSTSMHAATPQMHSDVDERGLMGMKRDRHNNSEQKFEITSKHDIW